MSLKTPSVTGYVNGMDKKTRKRYTKWGIVAGNALLLLLVSTFILANRSASQTVRSSTLNSATSTVEASTNPLDQLSSAQIALTAAQATQLPELNAIRNQADSDNLTLRVIPNDAVAVAKPQIVSTAQKSKQDIKTYVAVAGDSVSSVADKFGLNANSIKWSNNLTSNNINVGTKLVIPPVNGVVYTVKSGDTPASLGTRYQADPNQIIAYNDAEITGLKPGDQIIIPNGQIFTPVVSRFAAPSFTVVSFTATYGGNGYDYGYCTWYAASRVGVPTNWGNANTWDNYAAISGWTVSSVPVVGAVAQSDNMSYLGHVAVVEAVSPDGSMIKYSDMNGLAGWGRVGYSDWVSVGTYQHYIYH
jgi:LysM repeat protein